MCNVKVEGDVGEGIAGLGARHGRVEVRVAYVAGCTERGPHVGVGLSREVHSMRGGVVMAKGGTFGVVICGRGVSRRASTGSKQSVVVECVEGSDEVDVNRSCCVSMVSRVLKCLS